MPTHLHPPRPNGANRSADAPPSPAARDSDVAPASAPAVALMKIGELAGRTGKTVRALRHYEELELLAPAQRSDGGFRLYGPDAEARVYWLGKLQAMGFALAEIRSLLGAVEQAHSAPTAMEGVREVFRARLEDTRAQVAHLLELERDLAESLAYLEGCRSCTDVASPTVCATCDDAHAERHPQPAPDLVAGIHVRRRDAALSDEDARIK